jgi:hypothetical protein
MWHNLPWINGPTAKIWQAAGQTAFREEFSGGMTDEEG